MSSTKAKCKNCGTVVPYDELRPEDSPVATCPDCGGHRFKAASI